MKHNLKISIPMAIIITMMAVIYQRTTGPTYPKKVMVGPTETQQVKVKFIRSQGGTINAPIEIPKLQKGMTAKLHYKRYPTDDPWTTVDFKDEGNRLYAELPNQPPAGKLTYHIDVTYEDGSVQNISSKDDPIYIRYKGEVPTWILAPHIFFMFLSMLLSVVALFEAIFRTQSYKLVGRITLGCLMIGGMGLGPLVQKYAFGVYWAGFPFDYDLTDNKLLVGVLAWLFGVGMSLGKENKKIWPTIIAACVLFGVYSIPHSMQGSEFNYEKGVVETDID
jgi:hypothetical protein